MLMKKSKKDQKASSLFGVRMVSTGSVVISPASLATLSPLPPPPATIGFYSFMGVTKLHRVHTDVPTATEINSERMSSMRPSGEDSESENLRFQG